MTAFEDLPLHDATLETFVVHWGPRTAVARLIAFLEPGRTGHFCELRWHGVRRVALPHEAPWGNSPFVNRQGRENGRYWLEMQSGDVLEVQADGVTLHDLGEAQGADAVPG